MRTALETKVVEGVCNQRADVGSCVQPIIESSILITRVRYLPGDIHGGGPRHQHSIVVSKRCYRRSGLSASGKHGQLCSRVRPGQAIELRTKG
jgi:hypothetical protein